MSIQLTFDLKNDDFIVWQGQIVMSRSEEPYFEELFKCLSNKLHVTRVLEIGFGLGISAGLIQRYLRPSEHHVVEIDNTIAIDLFEFARHHPSVKAVLGDWRHASLDEPYDFVFYDPFDYLGETEEHFCDEDQLLHKLVGTSGVLCHPHFGDGEPRSLSGFRSVVLKRFQVPSINMADGTSCEHAAVVLCYPTS